MSRQSDYHFDNYNEIDFSREQLEFAVDRWLRSRGWESTCETPGSYWMWRREVEGHKYLVDRNHAISIQHHLDERQCSCTEEARNEKCVAHGGKD